ncbi:DNA mismatch repair protein MSH2 [Raphanus sativus]|nr:DNA mismatch repair protein MSH2 [Raphanus sativus]
MAYVDLTRRVLGLAEFIDDSRFTNLESSLVAIGAKECIFPAESGKTNECKSLRESLERCGVMTTERSRQEFKGRDLESDLKRLVKGNIEPVRDLISGFELATPALGALLSFSELLSDEGNYGNFTIRRYDIGGFMRLDSAAMRALNVMESKTDANKELQFVWSHEQNMYRRDGEETASYVAQATSCGFE